MHVRERERERVVRVCGNGTEAGKEILEKEEKRIGDDGHEILTRRDVNR